MSKSELPDRPSHDYLRKRAKNVLGELRHTDPRARLAAAQLAVARDHGFSSWRALKAEVDRRRAPTLTAFLAACDSGDAARLRTLLAQEPGLARERTPDGGTTGLHLAVAHVEAVRVLLQHGADPNARDTGDNASPLHFAAGLGAVDVVRALLDAGADVHGVGDAHRLEVIGWATCFGRTIDPELLDLLLAHGARHHVFSAIAARDHDAIQEQVEADPATLARRMSPTENRQTALHYVIAPPDGLIGGGFRTGAHHATLDLLIELGADVDAEDDRGRTPLAVAMLMGDDEAMRRLKAAGAEEPKDPVRTDADAGLAAAATSVRRVNPMIQVPNVRQTVEWYESIGFELEGAHELDTDAAWADVRLGDAYVMFVPGGGTPRRREVSMWFRTDQIDELYAVLKRRQLERATDVLAGKDPQIPEARFASDIHDTFYGQREFSIIDLNGYELNFEQPLTR